MEKAIPSLCITVDLHAVVNKCSVWNLELSILIKVANYQVSRKSV